MSAAEWEPDPDGVLDDDCWVRIGDGPLEGKWEPEWDASTRLAGHIITDKYEWFPVLRGLEQHVVVLREAVDNTQGLEPGQYNVTWASGLVSRHSPWTLREDGHWVTRGGEPIRVTDALRRATFERLPDPVHEHHWHRQGGVYRCIQGDDCPATATRLVPAPEPVDLDEVMRVWHCSPGTADDGLRAVLDHLGIPVKDES